MGGIEGGVEGGAYGVTSGAGVLGTGVGTGSCEESVLSIGIPATYAAARITMTATIPIMSRVFFGILGFSAGTGCTGVGLPGVAGPAGWSIGAPHDVQNFSSAEISAPHDVQNGI